MARTGIFVLFALLAGCSLFESRERTGSDPRPSQTSHPSSDPPIQEPPLEKDENPDSQVWPLDLWLVEFAKRNGCELKYRDRDMIGRSVLRPGPGPFETDAQALDILERVARRNGFRVLEERRHVYALRRQPAPNPITGVR